MPYPLITHIVEATTGGVARQLELLVRDLQPRGFALHFIMSLERDPAYAEQVKRFRATGVRVDIVPMARGLRPLRDLLAFRRVKKILRATRPALVHTHASKAGYLGRRAAHALGIPSVHTPHVFAFEWARGLTGMLYRKLESQAAQWCDRLVLLSDLQRESACAAGLAPPEKMTVIPNGVDKNEFFPATQEDQRQARLRLGLVGDGPVVGLAGRLEPQKGLGHFLHAAQGIRERLPAVRFLVAGRGSLEAEFCRLAGLELADSITFCGNISTMPEFYHALDCLVLASLWEGLPYVILEAQAAAVPVVASRTAGAETLIVDGESGILVPLQNESALAAGVMRVLSDPELAAHLGAWGRARVREHFSLESWGTALSSLYREIIASPSFSPHLS